MSWYDIDYRSGEFTYFWFNTMIDFIKSLPEEHKQPVAKYLHETCGSSEDIRELRQTTYNALCHHISPQIQAVELKSALIATNPNNENEVSDFTCDVIAHHLTDNLADHAPTYETLICGIVLRSDAQRKKILNLLMKLPEKSKELIKTLVKVASNYIGPFLDEKIEYNITSMHFPTHESYKFKRFFTLLDLLNKWPESYQEFPQDLLHSLANYYITQMQKGYIFRPDDRKVFYTTLTNILLTKPDELIKSQFLKFISTKDPCHDIDNHSIVLAINLLSKEEALCSTMLNEMIAALEDKTLTTGKQNCFRLLGKISLLLHVSQMKKILDTLIAFYLHLDEIEHPNGDNLPASFTDRFREPILDTLVALAKNPTENTKEYPYLEHIFNFLIQRLMRGAERPCFYNALAQLASLIPDHFVMDVFKGLETSLALTSTLDEVDYEAKSCLEPIYIALNQFIPRFTTLFKTCEITSTQQSIDEVFQRMFCMERPEEPMECHLNLLLPFISSQAILEVYEKTIQLLRIQNSNLEGLNVSILLQMSPMMSSLIATKIAYKLQHPRTSPTHQFIGNFLSTHILLTQEAQQATKEALVKDLPRSIAELICAYAFYGSRRQINSVCLEKDNSTCPTPTND